jgi:hypothetical protein
MPRLSARRPRTAIFLSLSAASLVSACLAAWVDEAAAQGSPYSDIYARAFGVAPPPTAIPATPLPGPGGAGEAASGDVVYVIEDGRLLTYRAGDYASGNGEALTRSPLPSAESAYSFSPPELLIPSIADRLYGTAPLETAAGEAAAANAEAPAPIPLFPPPN